MGNLPCETADSKGTMELSADPGPDHVHDHGRDHVPKAFLILGGKMPVRSYSISNGSTPTEDKTEEIKPVVGFLGLTLGVSSTSKVSRFKLSGRI